MASQVLDVSPSRHHGELALALQEALTATVRLRSGRQIAADAASFRTHMKNLLAAADRNMRNAGYATADVRLAIYAVIAFLDESVLNSRQPMFAAWPKKPLQEEIFGDHMAGEVFFQHLRDLLNRQETTDLADVLEVFQLCLVLGFKGRFTGIDRGELRSYVSAIAGKIERIRGAQRDLSPAWRLPSDERTPVQRDPWLPRIGAAVIGIAAFAFVEWVLFRLMLGPGIAELERQAANLVL